MDTIRMKAEMGFERTGPEGSGEGTETIRRGQEFDATPEEAGRYANRKRPLARPVDPDALADVPVGGVPRSQVVEYLRGLSAEERTSLYAEASGDTAAETTAPAPAPASPVTDDDAPATADTGAPEPAAPSAPAAESRPRKQRRS